MLCHTAGSYIELLSRVSGGGMGAPAGEVFTFPALVEFCSRVNSFTLTKGQGTKKPFHICHI